LICLLSHLNYKGQNNEDKGYFELTRDMKMEPLKQMLHPKPLGRKSPSKPPKVKYKINN
jgi:hypothetical protein